MSITTNINDMYTRIKKHEALLNFMAGKTVYLTTDDVTPDTLGRTPASIRPTPERARANGETDAMWFRRAVDMFKHFNCGETTGPCVAYYQAN